MIVLPSDHYVEGEQEFINTINEAVEVASKKRGLVTIGITPTRAETGYGYIQTGEKIAIGENNYRVERFLEKPNVEVVRDLLSLGNYVWNSGIFVWRADSYLREMEKYLPKMYKSLSTIYQNLETDEEEKIIREQYEQIEGISVDFGILQKTRKGYVVKSNFIWDDIGNFISLARFLEKKGANLIRGEAFLEQSENCYVFGKDKLLIGFGIKDLIIVDSGDILLIMDKNKDQEIKSLVDSIKYTPHLKEYM
jgi:mannose-1-phosphate guanylyltransferase